MSNEFEENYSEPAPSEARERPTRSARAGAEKPTQPRRPSQLTWWILGAAVVVAAGLGIYFGAIRSSSPAKPVKGTTPGPAIHGHYRLTYPKDWQTVAPDTVAPGQHAFAAVRQKKGYGVVVMRLGGKVANLTGSYVHGLESQLKRGSKDYKFVGSHLITIKAGHALDLTYDLTKHHQVRNVVVIPVASGSIVVATVARIGDAKTTREIDDIVSAFQLTS